MVSACDVDRTAPYWNGNDHRLSIDNRYNVITEVKTIYLPTQVQLADVRR